MSNYVSSLHYHDNFVFKTILDHDRLQAILFFFTWILIPRVGLSEMKHCTYNSHAKLRGKSPRTGEQAKHMKWAMPIPLHERNGKRHWSSSTLNSVNESDTIGLHTFTVVTYLINISVISPETTEADSFKFLIFASVSSSSLCTFAPDAPPVYELQTASISSYERW